MKLYILTITVLTLFIFDSCHSQDSKTVSHGLQVILKDKFDTCCTLRLYKYNPTNNCNQSKAISIVKDNKITPCFDYIRDFNDSEKVLFISLIQNPDTYGNEDVACFHIEYSVLAMDSATIVGFINISISCNKLISNPEIPARTAHSEDGLRKVGFTRIGRSKLLKLLGEEEIEMPMGCIK